MQYNIKAIPTSYAGVNFRSRLEARWAVFFDAMNWRWAYEPLDFGGWIPDFILHGARERILVEVKPLFEPDEALFAEISAQAIKAGSRDDILVLGADLIGKHSLGEVGFGWLGEYYPTGTAVVNDELIDRGPAHWWAAAALHSGSENGDIGFCHEFGSYRNRISGCHDGDSGAGAVGFDDDIASAWRDAGNIVQWQAKAAA